MSCLSSISTDWEVDACSGTDIVTTSLATTKYATTNYFYAGSILPTPLIHRYMGSTLYNRMRSGIGF